MKNVRRISVFDYKATGSKIKSLMDEENITVKELSAVIGVSYQAVYGYVRGNKLPSLEHLYMIAGFFNVTVDELLVPCPYIRT